MNNRLIDVARTAIRAHLEGAESARSAGENGPLPWGVFVSLHGPPAGRTEGPLRGCIGNLNLHTGSLEEEIGRAAVSSATSDPRFPPLRPDEVDGLQITVYLLDAPEAVDGPEELDPRRFGVIVTGREGRRGLLLPDLPGVDTPEQQVDIAVRKAGLPPGSDVSIQRFATAIIT